MALASEIEEFSATIGSSRPSALAAAAACIIGFENHVGKDESQRHGQQQRGCGCETPKGGAAFEGSLGHRKRHIDCHQPAGDSGTGDGPQHRFALEARRLTYAVIGYRKVRREQWRRRAHHTLMISGARQHDSLAIDDGSNPIRPHPLPPHDGEKIVGVPAVTKDIAEFALADDRHVDVEYRAFGDEADEQIRDLALLGFDHAPRGFRSPVKGGASSYGT